MSDPQASVSKPGEPGFALEGKVSPGHCKISFAHGVRASVAWLHARAQEMNDPHAVSILNSAAFCLGVDLAQSRLGLLQAHAVGGSPKPPNTIQGVIPEGWVLVPREPTPEMMAATKDALSGVDGMVSFCSHRGMKLTWKDGKPPLYHAWRAMIAAALSPTSGEGNMDSRADALEEELIAVGCGGIK